MATFKSYTDIEQAKKLAEILPIESADMWFYPYPNDEYWYDVPNMGNADKKYNQLPCWSLMALLEILPHGKILLHDKGGLGYKCICNNIDTDFHDSPVDACYEMILKLKKLKLLFAK